MRAILTTSIGIYCTVAVLTAEGGDILRGGTSVGARPGAPRKATMSPAQELATANAREALARTSKSIKAVQQMQAAARNFALHGTSNLRVNNAPLPNVPNGLKIGGLQVAPGVPQNLAQPTEGENPGLWIGALLPKETVSGDQTKVSIKQTEPQAVLNWQTFNVGKETTVVFNQKAGTAKDGSNNWIAFNKINDPSGVPSQILGSIKAYGAVYLINQNGIVFGGSSQVNLHSFVASSLHINDDLIGRLLNNPTGEFLFSASRVADPSFRLDGATSYVLGDSLVPGSTPTVTVASGSGATTLNGTTDFALTLDGSGKPMLEFTDVGLAKIGGGEVSVSYFNQQGGDIVVQPGARLTAPATAANVGGRISLIGPNVRNGGTISTPDGQTILAAGLQVGFASHPTDDPSLRGLDTFIGAEGSKTGTASNSGLIDAPRTSVLMAGKNVDQRGAIASTTSVSLNGRIDLLAEYDSVSSGGLANFAPFFPQTTGTVTFGANSVTQVVPELDNPETVVGTKLALESQVNARGRAIHFAKDATLLAPGADVTLSAGNWKLTGLDIKAPIHNFIYTSGQIYLDSGANINVAG
ncbi:MAG: filamentous hemagglutinin N-terminal domain-containing protein, partial [Chthoniobacteraceae bacterium]